jgi:hypothetical protein
MTDEQGRGTNPFWDPFGMWRHMAPGAAQVARPLAAQATGLGGLGARTMLNGLVDAVRSRLLGRRVTVGPTDGRVSLILTSLDVPTDPLSIAAGQLEWATLVAEDVEWRGQRFPTARAELHNVHTRPGTRPLLVAAPVDLVIVMPGERVAELVEQRVPRVLVEITEEASMRLRLRRRPGWGWVDVHPHAEGSRVLLRPTVAAVGSRERTFRRTFPRVHFGVGLGEGMRIASLELRPGAIEVRVRVDEWRVDLAESLAFAVKSR